MKYKLFNPFSQILIVFEYSEKDRIVDFKNCIFDGHEE